MKTYLEKAKLLAVSTTAKDTYLLFFGNTASAFLAFIFTLLVARNLSVEDFGVFAAATNMILIIASLTDVGISSGLVRFVAKNYSEGDTRTMNSYIKAGFVFRLITVTVFSLVIFLFAPFISRNLLATPDPVVSYWVAAVSLLLFFWVFFPFVFQAQKRFKESVVIELSLGVARVIFVAIFALGGLTIYTSLGAYALSAAVAIVVIFLIMGFGFLKAKPDRKIYGKLLRFSGWIGVNRIISSISGRLDVQMLANMAGATATGFYSIPQRLSFFIGVLASSYISVLSPRLAAFNDREKEKRYILKASLGLIPIVAGIIVWIIIANPFIAFLFGERYLPAVPIFRMLAISMIPFMLTPPAVAAIIYAIKKPIYIGTFSFFQIAAIFLLNLLFIPRYGAMGPTFTFLIVHTILAAYTWGIVIKYYWIDRKI
jgi:O-antigen/teichoic acid export membrane protein